MNPIRMERLPWRQIDGRAIIVQPEAGAVHELNGVGTLLWNLADGKKSFDDMADAVVHEFDVDLSTAQADVSEFFAELQQRGLARL